MPELERISIKGFKSLGEVIDLKLGSTNVLIGSNGSGKSNFIGVFSFLRDLKEGRLQEYVRRSGGAERLLHFGSKTTDSIEIFLVFSGEVNQYRIALGATDADQLYPENEVVYYWDKFRYPNRPWHFSLSSNGLEAAISGKTTDRVSPYIKEHFDRWRVYHFHDTSSSSPMKKSASVDDNRFLRADGSNLAAFLYLLKSKHEESYGLIRSAVQRVFPVLADFVLERDALNESVITLQWKHRNSDAFFDASSLSDGTLRFIALATLFLQPVTLRPSVALVDEPELGLHPYAIGVLAALVKQASTKTQVILSTQSPLLLDYFDPEDVIVADLIDGKTQLSRLNSESLEKWLDQYSLGQLWEKNEIGGRPRAGVKG
jgi:predicted ATPase